MGTWNGVAVGVAGCPGSSMMEISFKVLILAKELGKLASELFGYRAP